MQRLLNANAHGCDKESVACVTQNELVDGYRQVTAKQQVKVPDFISRPTYAGSCRAEAPIIAELYAGKAAVSILYKIAKVKA